MQDPIQRLSGQEPSDVGLIDEAIEKEAEIRCIGELLRTFLAYL
jgi:hypothetical protein